VTDQDAVSETDGSESLNDGTTVGLPHTSGDRSRFDPGELRRVIAAFPLTGVREIREFSAGSRQAPKVRIVAEEGEFLLKRRTTRPDLIARATFNHQLQLHLEAYGVPVARLVGTTDDNKSMLVEGGQVYEMFHWVEGRRMVKAPQEAINAGRMLGRVHLEATRLEWNESPLMPGFHAAAQVDSAFERLEPAIVAADPDVDRSSLHDVVKRLAERCHVAADRVDSAGWDALPVQPIHGDWHPGNVLFTPEKPTRRRPGAVRAVIDFDASRVEPRLVDVANGLLHFAMRSDRSVSPAEWPTSLSPRRMQAFADGWKAVAEDQIAEESQVLPALMIECLIAESVVPIARSGCFATVPGHPFLEMVAKKAEWINSISEEISGLL
jgi:Ser/Thr protein kinase RdoA (MazF antagonist)